MFYLKSYYQLKSIIDFDFICYHLHLLLFDIILPLVDIILSIDYEYASMNFLPHDIGNHFCEYAGVDEVDYSLYPKRGHQLKWIAVYLEEAARLRGERDPKISDVEIEKLYVQANHFALAAHFYWSMWALVQAHFSAIDFDFLGYGIARFNEYFRRKEEFLALSYD